LNCRPCSLSLTHQPSALSHSPAVTEGSDPTTVVSSRCPRVFTRRTQKPLSSLWNVTRSISPEISSVAGLRCGIAAFMRGDSFSHESRDGIVPGVIAVGRESTIPGGDEVAIQMLRLRGNMKALICIFVLLSFAVTAWAAHPFHVEDMQRLSRVGAPRVSPDGKWVVFTVTRGDVERNRSVTNIWRIPAAGGDPQQITFREQGFNGDMRWSPDGRYLYFVSTRADNKRQIFRLPVNGCEAKQVTTVPTGVDTYVLSPDGKTIAITSSVFPSCTDMACNEKMAKERTDNPVKTRVITDIPFRRWDTWVDGMRNHIFLVPDEGGVAKDVTPGAADSPIWTENGTQEVAFSPDSREICFSRFVENEALTGNSDLFVMPTSGGAPKAITTNKATDSTPLYSPDGRYIAYSATLRPMQETDLTRLFLYDRMTGEHRNAFETTDRSMIRTCGRQTARVCM
jgi:WD40 repeat protein